MKRTTIIFAGLALTAAVVFAQDKPATSQPAAANATAQTAAAADPIIITAGDITVRQSEFEGALKTLPAEYQQYAQGPGKRQFADDYLRMKMLAAQGYKDGVQNSAEVVQQMNLMRDNIVANAELQKIEKGVTVSDADLKKLYDANKNDYEQVKARHILIAFKGSPAAQPGKKELTEAEAKAKAEDIRKQLAAGADFAELAKKESDDTGSGARGGELGTFGRGQMVPEFEKAAFEAKTGEVTPVIRTQYGYHIIKVDSRETTPFDDVKATLEKNERQKKVQAALDAMKASASPVFNTAYFPPAPAPEAAPATAAPAKTEAAKPAAEKKPAPKKQ